MIPLYTPQQVRTMDQRAFARGVSPLALMERAAGHLARAVLDVGGRGYGLRVALLCGKGNNGGDGLAAARRLLDAGAQPAVWLIDGDSGLSDDAAVQLERWRARGGRVAASAQAALAGADVAVDCLLGTGTQGALRGPYADAVEAINGFEGQVVACDLPTGVDADSGAVPGLAVRAGLTMTLGAHKRGLHAWPARGFAGRVVLGELGILDGADDPVAWSLEAADAGVLLPPGPQPGDDKRDRGVVVALAGSAGMAGAAALVGRGALVAGAGLVTVATAQRAQPLVAGQLPEALTAGLPEGDAGAAFEVLSESLAGASALAVGPGLGREPATVELVRRIVREVAIPIVLDADGINAFRGEGEALADHVAPLLVVTPHARELARLAGIDDAWSRRMELAGEWSKAWGAVVVAKGPGTLTAAPDGRMWLNATGGPALASGGTGDVLTGVTAALLAQRAAPETVAAAVFLHGLAGDEAARRLGTRSVTAVDVVAAVPAAFEAIESAQDAAVGTAAPLRADAITGDRERTQDGDGR